jgi:hypothetical protein
VGLLSVLLDGPIIALFYRSRLCLPLVLLRLL